jgi:hypothetical protein
MIIKSMGLWQWYIIITITILDIIHRPAFHLKLNSNVNFCLYPIGNTLRLRYEPNRLMLSIGLLRWYINVAITILDIIHRPVFYLKYNGFKTRFCFHFQVKPTQSGDRNYLLSPTKFVPPEDVVRIQTTKRCACKKKMGRKLMSRIAIVIYYDYIKILYTKIYKHIFSKRLKYLSIS